MGDAEDVSFSGVSAADEDSAVGDGGPEKGSVPVWAHVCPLRRGENTRRRGIGFSGFGCTHEDSALGASFGGGGGSSDGASGPSAVMSVGERKKFARAEVGFGGGHKGFGAGHEVGSGFEAVRGDVGKVKQRAKGGGKEGVRGGRLEGTAVSGARGIGSPAVP